MRDREIVRKDMEELYLGNLGTVEFDLELPESGKHGSRISWHSDKSEFYGSFRAGYPGLPMEEVTGKLP